jgi:hypothetical protein
MAEAAVKQEFTIEREPPFVRRFERPDIDKHAIWFIPRLLKSFPQLNERSAYTWLLNILTSNEFMFLYFDHGVALAQTVQYGLKAEAVVEEQFVWIDDPLNKDAQEDASFVYEHFHEWAKRKGLSIMIVEENSDVPHDMIARRLEKRLFERKQVFCKVK